MRRGLLRGLTGSNLNGSGKTARGSRARVEGLESRALLSASPVDIVGVSASLGKKASLAPRLDLAAQATVADEIVPGGVILRKLGPRPQIDLSAKSTATNSRNRPRLDVGAFDVVLKKGPNLTANAQATAAFEAAATFIESLFSDPVTIVIDAEIAPLGPGIIGSTGSAAFTAGYDTIRNAVVADRAADESIAASLPTSAQFTASVPAGGYTINGMSANRATLLAIGFTPAQLGSGNPSQYDPSVQADMDITFSSTFAFDYDRSNGISAGQQDFIGVAIHEIAHGLGFTSEVDYVDFAQSNPGAPKTLFPGPLDLYRLRPGHGQANFTGNPRVLAPGNVVLHQVMYDGGVFNPASIVGIPGLTTGDVPHSTGRVNGDGQQASHWKDNTAIGFQIGLMDPTSAGTGQQLNWLAPDNRAMGLIGWNLAPTVSATPGTPDLVAATDTGSSNTDNITNRDNSAVAKNLQFSVTGTVSGATVSLYSSGTFIGSAVASGTTTTVTTNGAVDLADGARSITARQTESGKTESPDSAALGVTIDTAAPTVDVTDVSPDPRLDGVASVNVVFNQAVTGFDLADLALTRTSVNVPLTAGQAPTTADNITFNVPNLAALTSVNGTYQLTVNTGSGIADVAGNALAVAGSDTWIHSLPAWLAGGSNVTWNSLTKALTVNGAATINANPGADAPLITGSSAAAVLTINPSADRAVRVAGLTLTGGATATLTSLGAGRTAANSRVLVVNGNTFTIDINSTLDLTDNNLVLNYSGGTPVAGVEAMLKAGYNGGNWLGKRVTSSKANANANFALGVADNANLAIPFNTTTRLFAGEAVDVTSVLVKFTHRVDLDLDGVITTNDATIFNSNYSESSAAFWSKGDLDFDGLFTTNDATFFNSFYNELLPPV